MNPPVTPSRPYAESLSGLVERVTYFNEENGFAVLKVKVKGHREPVTIVGSLPSVSPGEWLTAQGNWIQDRECGPQFKANITSCLQPVAHFQPPVDDRNRISPSLKRSATGQYRPPASGNELTCLNCACQESTVEE